jgi:hypothetical protein
MKLNINSNLASLYRYFYLTTELPNNLCTFRQGLLIAMVCIPFVLPALLLNRYVYKTFVQKTYFDEYDKEYTVYRKLNNEVPTFIGILIYIGFLGLGGITIRFLWWVGILSTEFANEWPVYIQLLIILGFGLGTTFLSVISVLSIFEAWTKIKKIKEPKTQEEWDIFWKKQEEKDKANTLKRIKKEKNPGFWKILCTRIKAIKEKNCPIIEWDNYKPQ